MLKYRQETGWQCQNWHVGRPFPFRKGTPSWLRAISELFSSLWRIASAAALVTVQNLLLLVTGTLLAVNAQKVSHFQSKKAPAPMDCSPVKLGCLKTSEKDGKWRLPVWSRETVFWSRIEKKGSWWHIQCSAGSVWAFFCRPNFKLISVWSLNLAGKFSGKLQT